MSRKQLGHEVRAQEEVGSRNALSDIITTSHMWI